MDNKEGRLCSSFAWRLLPSLQYSSPQRRVLLSPKKFPPNFQWLSSAGTRKHRFGGQVIFTRSKRMVLRPTSPSGQLSTTLSAEGVVKPPSDRPAEFDCYGKPLDQLRA